MAEIIDVSNEKLSDEKLSTIDYDQKLYRLSGEQVEAIVRLLYLTHQGVHEVDDALDSVRRLYESYSAISAGDYYVWELGDRFREGMKPEEAKEAGSSFWIARKNYDGFVTRSVEYRHELEGFDVPDPHVYVNSDFVFRPKLVQVGVSTPWKEDSRVIQWDDFSQYFVSQIELRNGYFPGVMELLADQHIADCKEGWGEDKYSEEEWNERRTQWVEVEMKKMGFKVHVDHACARKIGFHPDTGEMETLEEVVAFMKRFLDGKEEGKLFEEY
jgi:hypothetical protein